MVEKSILVSQFSGDQESFRIRLSKYFAQPNLERVRFAVAYARWDGIGHVSKSIEQFLEAGGRFETIFGYANGVTTTDALYYGLLLKQMFPSQTYSGYVQDAYANASFHPKYYEFRYNTKTIILVGSANLTGGGLCRNGELGCELEFSRNEKLELDTAEYWKSIKKIAKAVTAQAIKDISQLSGAGNEKKSEYRDNAGDKPFLPGKTKVAPKPLFKKILELSDLKQKAKDELLGNMTALTDRPSNLFLEIFKRETGGNKGKPGYAVQIPVATLGAFFGVARNENREIKIDFPTGPLTPTFMHLSNNTHRLRLRPILDVPRPAIIHFKRVGVDHYSAKFIAGKDYTRVLKKECGEQSRPKARRWGIR